MQSDSICVKRRPTTVTLAPDLLLRLDAAAEAQDRSRPWLTARAIAEYLDRHPLQTDATP
jgi:predicted transcriptional regulator